MKALFTSRVPILLFTLIAFYLHQLNAQEPHVLHYTSKEGLPFNSIYQIYENNEGLLYLGGSDGLCTFDGRNFTKTPLTEFLDDYVIKLIEGHNESLWMLNLSGELGRVYEDSVSKVIFDNVEENQPQILNLAVIDNLLILLIQNKDGSRGIARIDIQDTQKDNYEIETIMNFQGIDIGSSKLSTLGKNLVFHEGYNLHFLNPYESQVDSVKTVSVQSYGRFLWNHEDKLYSTIGTNTIIQYTDDFKQKKLCSTQDHIHLLFFINNEIWFSHRPLGVSILNDQGEIRSLLPSIRVNHILKDSEGRIWIGTDNKGLFLIPNENVQLYTPSDAHSDAKHHIYKTLNYDDVTKQFFSSTSDGTLYKITSKGEIELFYNYPHGIRDLVSISHNMHVLGGNNDLLLLKNGFPQWKISSIAVKDIEQIDKSVYIGTHMGILKYDNDELPYLKGDENVKGSLKRIFNARVFNLYADNSKQLWFSSTKGIFKYSPELDSLYKIETISDNIHINSFVQTNMQEVWMASSNNGIFCISGDSLKKAYSMEMGLISNSINKLYYDATNDLVWALSNEGISTINPQNGKVKNLTSNSQLPSASINDIIRVDSLIWLATDGGLASIPDDFINTKINPPKIYFRNILVENERTSNLDKIITAFNNNNIKLEFDCYLYGVSDDPKFEYRFNSDDPWVTTTSQEIQFPPLRPNEYTFELRAKIDDQYSEIKEIEVFIKKAWWQSIWMKIATVIVLVALGWLVKKITENRLLKIQRRRRTSELLVSKLKMKTLQSQLTPHFIFNYLSTIQNRALKRQNINSVLSNFSYYLRRIFEYSELEDITLEEEIDFLKNYVDLENEKLDDKINLSLDLTEFIESNIDQILVPPMIIQPIVENSIKHAFHRISTSKKISIKFYSDPTYMYCLVEDNGIGVKDDFDLERMSGTKIVERRLSLFNDSDGNITLNKTSSLGGAAFLLKIKLIIDKDFDELW